MKNKDKSKDKSSNKGARRISSRVSLIPTKKRHFLSDEAKIMLSSSTANFTSRLNMMIASGALPFTESSRLHLATFFRHSTTIDRRALNISMKWLDLASYLTEDMAYAYSILVEQDKINKEIQSGTDKLVLNSGIVQTMTSLLMENAGSPILSNSQGVPYKFEDLFFDVLNLMKEAASSDTSVFSRAMLSLIDKQPQVTPGPISMRDAKDGLSFVSLMSLSTDDNKFFNLMPKLISIMGEVDTRTDSDATILGDRKDDIVQYITSLIVLIFNQIWEKNVTLGDDRGKFNTMSSKDAVAKVSKPFEDISDGNGGFISSLFNDVFVNDGTYGKMNSSISSSAAKQDASVKMLKQIIRIIRDYASSARQVGSYLAQSSEFMKKSFNNDESIVLAFRNMVAELSESGSDPEFAERITKNFIEKNLKDQSAAHMIGVISTLASSPELSLADDVLARISPAELAKTFNDSAIAAKYLTLSHLNSSRLPGDFLAGGAEFSVSSSVSAELEMNESNVLTMINKMEFRTLKHILSTSQAFKSNSKAKAAVSEIYGMLMQNATSNPEVKKMLISGLTKLKLSADYKFNETARGSSLVQVRTAEAAVTLDGAARRLAVELWILNMLLTIYDALYFYQVYTKNVQHSLVESSMADKNQERLQALMDEISGIVKEHYGYMGDILSRRQDDNVLPIIKINGASDPLDCYLALSDMLFNKSSFNAVFDTIRTFGNTFTRMTMNKKTLSDTVDVFSMDRSLFSSYYPYLLGSDLTAKDQHDIDWEKLMLRMATSDSLQRAVWRNSDSANFSFAIQLDGNSAYMINSLAKSKSTIKESAVSELFNEETKLLSYRNNFLREIISTVIERKLTKYYKGDDDAILRYNAFSARYGNNILALMEIGNSFAEGTVRRFYNEAIDLYVSRNTDVLELVLNQIGLSKDMILSDMEAEYFVQYVKWAQSTEDTYFPFKLSSYGESSTFSGGKTNISSLIVLSDRMTDIRQAGDRIYFYRRDVDCITSLFDYNVKFTDLTSAQLSIVSPDSTLFLVNNDDMFKLIIEGEFPIEYHEPIRQEDMYGLVTNITASAQSFFSFIDTLSDKKENEVENPDEEEVPVN